MLNQKVRNNVFSGFQREAFETQTGFDEKPIWADTWKEGFWKNTKNTRNV